MILKVKPTCCSQCQIELDMPKSVFILYEVNTLKYDSYCKNCSDKKLADKSTKSKDLKAH